MTYLLIAVLLTLSACTPKATFIQGGPGSSASVDVNMTGGRIILTGPFVYCADSATKKDPGSTLLNCPIVETVK